MVGFCACNKGVKSVIYLCGLEKELAALAPVVCGINVSYRLEYRGEYLKNSTDVSIDIRSNISIT